MVEHGCTTIKTKELENLYQEIKNLKIKHQEELKILEKQLNIEKQRVKPDVVDISIDFYIINRPEGYIRWGYEEKYKPYPSIETTLNLSHGIRSQLRKLLNLSVSKLDKHYKSILDSEIKNSYLQGKIEGFNQGKKLIIDNIKNKFLFSNKIIKFIKTLEYKE